MAKGLVAERWVEWGEYGERFMSVTVPFSALQGKVFTKVERITEKTRVVSNRNGVKPLYREYYEGVLFERSNGEIYVFHHEQSCCEDVHIESVVGDLDDLVGVPIVVAEEVTNYEGPPKGEEVESETWTFYKLRTIKGSVDIRWYGTSNGYYSETAELSLVWPARKNNLAVVK